jgi:hypothetical protein
MNQKKLEKITWWILIITLAILTPLIFRFADYQRGFDSTGGELVMLVLFVAVILGRRKVK